MSNKLDTHGLFQKKSCWALYRESLKLCVGYRLASPPSNTLKSLEDLSYSPLQVGSDAVEIDRGGRSPFSCPKFSIQKLSFLCAKSLSTDAFYDYQTLYLLEDLH